MNLSHNLRWQFKIEKDQNSELLAFCPWYINDNDNLESENSNKTNAIEEDNQGDIITYKLFVEG